MNWEEAQRLSWPEWRERLAGRLICELPYPERGAAVRAYEKWFAQECKAGRAPDAMRQPEKREQDAIAGLRLLAEELGKTPTVDEVAAARSAGRTEIPSWRTITTVFGTYVEACAAAGLEANERPTWRKSIDANPHVGGGFYEPAEYIQLHRPRMERIA